MSSNKNNRRMPGQNNNMTQREKARLDRQKWLLEQQQRKQQNALKHEEIKQKKREKKRRQKIFTPENQTLLQKMQSRISDEGISHLQIGNNGIYILFGKLCVIQCDVSDGFTQRNLANNALPQVRMIEPMYDFRNDRLFEELSHILYNSVTCCYNFNKPTKFFANGREYEFYLKNVYNDGIFTKYDIIQSPLHGGVSGSTHSSDALQIINYTRIIVTLVPKNLFTIFSQQ
jgi:hypothetical protein